MPAVGSVFLWGGSGDGRGKFRRRDVSSGLRGNVRMGEGQGWSGKGIIGISMPPAALPDYHLPTTPLLTLTKRTLTGRECYARPWAGLADRRPSGPWDAAERVVRPVDSRLAAFNPTPALRADHLFAVDLVSRPVNRQSAPAFPTFAGSRHSPRPQNPQFFTR